MAMLILTTKHPSTGPADVSDRAIGVLSANLSAPSAGRRSADGPMRIRTILAMSRDRATDVSPPGFPAAATGLPILPLALLAAAIVAALLASQQVLPGWLGAIALLLATAGALFSGACWRGQRQLDPLREARLQNQLLGQLIDVWCWQTDAEHRLVKLQPPAGAIGRRHRQAQGAGALPQQGVQAW